MQSDTRKRVFGLGDLHAGTGTPGAAGRHDFVDRGAGLFPAAIATSIGSQAQKPLAIVVVGAMLCTLFLTRYMMPILYSYFPAPRGSASHDDEHLVEGTNYSPLSSRLPA